ncbi:SIR2 family protein [Photobacterium phosphoreum]|uniref:SIR2 family protein n=1 Tax=Photobacterium phosphoreum TaxID=659 RepID=UPI001E37FF19|nr:SIR2 family protein [Photobacterium phosphoreum]MCD9510615.1 hypothetical protein [Photobacterium phosphoreum]
MRFNSNGPDIPDVLLERRDKGRVIFLCGAGISFSSGLPGFAELTEYVIDFYSPAEESEISKAFLPWTGKKSDNSAPKVPLDQIFHLLYQEYGREEVNSLVAKKLSDFKPQDDVGFEHSLIRRLSTSADGKPQIVTTNFDLLLEHGVEIPYHQPPVFPDIELGEPLEGITYLHGRLNDTGEGRHPYILSSADFGRAYLSEGWATSFILKLLERYTVVLVGYQAEDPQVKYLLQGLNHDGKYDRTKIFAFDKGEPEDIEVKWRDRGVTAVAYSDHPVLWDTLELWAERADDHRAWRAKVIELAKSSPRELESFQRGMVAHVIKTNAGAKAFARAYLPPHPEWLCVFDSKIRYGEVKTNIFDGSEFDPLKVYGLDSDLDRTQLGLKLDEGNCGKRQVGVHEDLLTGSRGDQYAGMNESCLGSEQLVMPSRLYNLSRWILRVCDSPVVAWWVVKSSGLHPVLSEQLKRSTERSKDSHPNESKVWSLIFDSVREHGYHDDYHYILLDLIKQHGWSLDVLQFVHAKMAPYLTYTPPLGSNVAQPPEVDWNDVTLSCIANWGVKSPFRDISEIKFPEVDVLPLARILESHLRQADRLRQRIAHVGFYLPTCYPEEEEGKEDYQEFYAFLSVFDELVKSKPDDARSMALCWNLDESIQFTKLKLYALSYSSIFSGREVVDTIHSLDKAVFWRDYFRRELLLLIKGRWDDLSRSERELVIAKVFEGPEKYEHWEEREYPKLRDSIICNYLKWLEGQGIVIPNSFDNEYSALIPVLDRVDGASVDWLVEPRRIKVSSVRQDESMDVIANLPAHQVIDAIKEIPQREIGSFVSAKPFSGLVKLEPKKAMAALSYAAKKCEYPSTFWNELLQSWPKTEDIKLLQSLLRRLTAMPYAALIEIRHSLSYWFNEFIVKSLLVNEKKTWSAFDKFIVAMSDFEGDASQSTIANVSVGGKSLNLSRRTNSHAINSPIRKLTESLFKQLRELDLKEGDGIPDFIKNRFSVLTSINGEGQYFAVITFSKYAEWMFWLEPEWTVNNVVPWFSFSHQNSEPAWYGFIANCKVPSFEFFEHIKGHLNFLFPELYKWSWGEGERKIAAQIIIELGIPYDDNPSYFTKSEVRNSIRNMKNAQRSEAIYHLKTVGKREDGNWEKQVLPFIEEVWPREKKLRTKSEIKAWIRFLIFSKKELPMLLDSMKWCLTAVQLEPHWMHKLTYSYRDETPLAIAYPNEILELCSLVTLDNISGLPIHLGEVLDLIEQASPALVKDKRFQLLLDLAESELESSL